MAFSRPAGRWPSSVTPTESWLGSSRPRAPRRRRVHENPSRRPVAIPLAAMDTVLLLKSRPGRLAHVFAQHPRLGLAQIDEHQAVERVAERGIDAESQDPTAEAQVLAQQHRRALAVRLESRNEAGELVDVRG